MTKRSERQLEAVRCIIRQKNPFHGNTRIQIQRRGFDKLQHALLCNQTWMRFVRTASSLAEFVTMWGAFVMGLLIGFILAAGVTSVGIAVIINLWDVKLVDFVSPRLAMQIGHTFGAGILVILLLYILPYLWWVIPLTLAVRAVFPFYLLINHRKQRQQLKNAFNDDLLLLPRLAANRLPRVHLGERWRILAGKVTISGRAAAILTGHLASLLICAVWVKYYVYFWHRGDPNLLLLMTWFSCISPSIVPFLYHRTVKRGDAVAAMLNKLFQESHLPGCINTDFDYSISA